MLSNLNYRCARPIRFEWARNLAIGLAARRAARSDHRPPEVWVRRDAARLRAARGAAGAKAAALARDAAESSRLDLQHLADRPMLRQDG